MASARKATQKGEPGCLLRLYISNRAGRSIIALANLQRLLGSHLKGCQVEVVDLVKEPAVAKRDEIVALPTLIRVRPGPVRRVVGDLSNAERVVSGLGLTGCLGVERFYP